MNRMLAAKLQEKPDERVVTIGPYTVCELRHGEKKAYGLAICGPRDKWNRRLGIQIARGRALKELAKRL